MFLHEKELTIPLIEGNLGLLEYFSEAVIKRLPKGEVPIRFVITRTDSMGYHCELGILSDQRTVSLPSRGQIFDFKKRDFESIEEFNAVFLVPTGIGAEIGGHSGDAGPVARLLGSVCDNLITHPNTVNASDINEMPDNSLYVEGSVITALMMGTVALQKVRSNRVMLVIDKHEDSFFHEAAVNAVSAARATLGLDCPLVVEMNDKVVMRSLYSTSGRAVGRIDNLERLSEVLEVNRLKYDAVALSSVINVPKHFHKEYFLEDIINPWGGVEAMLTHAISMLYNIPSAHSPMMESREVLDLTIGIVDPRKAAEAVSMTFLNSIFKGLHRSPRILNNGSAVRGPGILSVEDISCLIIPDGCIGLPTLAAMEQGIPVIAVRENRNRMQNKLGDLPFLPGKLFIVDNYLEAVGVMTAIKAGVSPASVRRPLSNTTILEAHHKDRIPSTKNEAKRIELSLDIEKQRKIPTT